MNLPEAQDCLEKGGSFESMDEEVHGHSKLTTHLTYHLKTLFLFTKSDFKTVILPQSIFAISLLLSSAPPTAENTSDVWLERVTSGAIRVPLMITWLWLNLLVEDIANQRLSGSIVEDKVNKPWRPLPSERLTPEQARDWLLSAVLVAVGFSVMTGCYMPSASLIIMVWMYNDLDGSNSSIWCRNALNAGGLMCFSWGALVTLSGSAELLPRSYFWIVITGGVVFTTVHAQDLPDMEGDMARGRLTMPLKYGDMLARTSLAIMVLFWSVACPAFWSASLWGWLASLGIGGIMAILAMQRRGQEWDEAVWKMWCLWVTTLFLLPASV